MKIDNLWIRIAVACALFVSTQGGCKIPSKWIGSWFESGADKLVIINSTHISSKGECISQEPDKYIFYHPNEKLYRCVVVYNKHINVLQYKESYPAESEVDLCNSIPGDGNLISMFRNDSTPVTCPFKNPPFTMTYRRDQSPECKSPPSRVDSCTDDTRMVFRYQACYDVDGSEAAVEELECIAIWKDGSNHYMVGKLHHRHSPRAKTDEEVYRCFVYKKRGHNYYDISQSSGATCVDVSLTDGFRFLKLNRTETQLNRCKFPNWVTSHYHWHSLDYRHNFRFTHHNASLRISSTSGEVEDKLVCHTVVSESPTIAQLIVHVVSGCDGGYKCMTFYKRDSNIIQMYESGLTQNSPDNCSLLVESSSVNPPVTLITASLPSLKCPLEGKYTPQASLFMPLAKASTDSGISVIKVKDTSNDFDVVSASNDVIEQECIESAGLRSLFMGCSPKSEIMEFHSNCKNVPATSYSCNGSWKDNTTTYVIGSPVNRHSTDARHYCFIFSQNPSSNSLFLQRVTETCATGIKPMEWSLNITEIGKCSRATVTMTSSTLLTSLSILIIFLYVFVYYR